MKIKNLVGENFGRLTVVSFSHSDGASYWDCQCKCGKTVKVAGRNLSMKRTLSCGCLKSDKARAMCVERNKKHGLSKTREFNIWMGMIGRCHNPKNPAWKRYGGRGISVCKRWRKSFKNFISDMGKKPNGKSLDRIDNDGNYTPSNCRWATKLEQANNASNCRFITAAGKTMTLSQWSRETGINCSTISQRIDKYKWPVEWALCMQ